MPISLATLRPESSPDVRNLSRRSVLTALAAVVPATMFATRALAQPLRGDELPLHTTGLEHIGIVVPDTEKSARFYSRLFNPEIQKEKDAPLRYYVMMGTGYMAIGSRAGVIEAKIDHYCTLVNGYDRELMNAALAAKGMPAAARGVVPDPDGIGLQLIAVPGGPGPTAVPGGRLVDGAALVMPIGFDNILLKVQDLRRSADFYSNFYNPIPADAADQLAFAAADTRIILRAVGAGENAGVERFTMRVAAFDSPAVAAELAPLGATIEASAPGLVRFRDPDGLGVELRQA
jgi:catechol 2,3-dioxygenase-like lactoylglutathione lyase family enzyme